VSSTAPSVEKVVIDGPAGAIEGMIERPPDARDDVVAVCCHPHPLYGGAMQNKVVHTLARSCQDQGITSVRFNFRGVGASEGTYDDGAGESDDAGAVADWANERRAPRDCGRSASRSAASSPTGWRRCATRRSS
jgi:alpha/beta superfamily hydrolase